MVFRLAVAAGIRRGGLLNTAPNTIVLTKEGLVGFAAEAQAIGESDGRHRRARAPAFPQ